MVTSVSGHTANELYTNLWWTMSVEGQQDHSRGGAVLTIRRPVVATLRSPTNRVLFAPARRPNPVFHLMEAIWMLAGYQRVEWLQQFNSNIIRFAEAEGFIHGAYGWRWRNHFDIDQIHVVGNRLRISKNDRQAVMAMWDPKEDLPQRELRDRPCNTHIYWRVVNNRLDMTVCNRSNDLVWGMMGSNIVHMTILHEVMAAWVGVEIGEYRVFTINLHAYHDSYDIEELEREAKTLPNAYPGSYPLLREDENPVTFLDDCISFVNGGPTECEWFDAVARPMKDWYLSSKHTRQITLETIKAPDWRESCRQWMDK